MRKKEKAVEVSSFQVLLGRVELGFKKKKKRRRVYSK